MANYEETLAAIREYQEKYRAEGSLAFVINEPFDLFPQHGSPRFSGIKGWNRSESWPDAGRTGVYLVFDEDLVLRYVGKASMNNTIGARLFSHFGAGEECKPGPHWTRQPRYLVTVAMPEGRAFEAPALEEYLIATLHPADNTAGRHRG